MVAGLVSYYKGDAPSDNIDNLIEGYYVARNVKWNPVGTTVYGTLLVFPGYRVQMYIDVAARIAVRVMSNDNWCAWVQL